MSNILIAYFSRKGENYISGSIKDLKIGNTEIVAKMISEITNGNLFEIKSINEYSKDYTQCTEEAKREKNAKARPELTDTVEKMNQYDTIYLGYPNWWGTCPMAVFTFLEAYDLSGKTIIPFCTHEGSGMGSSEGDIKKVASKATVVKGLAIHGTNASSAKSSVEKWIAKNR